MKNPKRPNRPEPIVSFSNETLLQAAVRGLLARIPEVTLPQRTHGPAERGKDIVFYLPGGLGRPTLCAAVIKNTQITGNVASPTGGLAVLNQVQQAFAHPIILGDGSKVHVSKVFVITPFDLSQTALHAMQGALRDHANKTEFVGGTELHGLFRKHWPDFVYDEYSAIKSHLKQLANELNAHHAFTHIGLQYRLEAGRKTISTFYVKPQFHVALTSYSHSRAIDSFIFDAFASASRIVMRVKDDKITDAVEADPNRKVVTRDDIAEVERASQRLSDVIPILLQWEYVTPSGADEALQQSVQYRHMVANLREQAIARKKSEVSTVPLADLRARAGAVELSREESQQLLSAASLLRAKITDLWKPLQSDLDRAADLVSNQSVGGFKALQHPAFRICGKLEGLAERVPHDMLSATAKRVITFGQGLLNEVRSSLLIVGPAGYGKTSFCRWNALHDAGCFERQGQAHLPVYVPLHELATGSLGSFEKMFLSHVGHSALLPDGVQQDFKNGKATVRLYLDGLDEIPTVDRQERLMRLACQGATRWNNIQVVVTARDYVAGPWLDWLPRFHLSDFNDSQIQALTTNWLDSAAQCKAFRGQLTDVASLASVMKIPLLATLTLLVFRQTKNLPGSRTRLFEIFVELLNEGWDLAKQVNRGTKFGSAVKTAVLQRLALKCHEERTRKCSEKMFDTVALQCLRAGDVRQKRKELQEEILADGLLMRSGNQLAFAHLSFQEFLAAACLMGEPKGRRASRVLSEYLLGDDWWLEVLKCYIGLSAKPKDLTNWFEEMERKVPATAREKAGLQVGRLLREVRIGFPELSE